MRMGEVLALRWGDVDLQEAVVRVRRSMTGGTVGTPKNRERRDVDLISDVVKLLASMYRTRAHSDAERLVFHIGDSASFPLAHDRAAPPPLPGNGGRRYPSS